MKNAFLFPVLLVLFVLGACQTDRPNPPPTELPFATDPSVLRGDWSGTIQNVPAEQDVTLTLVDLVAACPEAAGKCFSYTFEGKASVGGSDFVPISGRGYTGGNRVYVLTSPARPLGFDATFELGGATWQLYADYVPYLYGSGPSPEAPLYQGGLSVESSVDSPGGTERRGEFQLEPAP